MSANDRIPWVDFPFFNEAPHKAENRALAVQQLMEQPIGPDKTPKIVTLYSNFVFAAGTFANPFARETTKRISEDFGGFFRIRSMVYKSVPFDFDGTNVNLSFSVSDSRFPNDPFPLSTLHSHRTGFDVSEQEWPFEKQTDITYKLLNHNAFAVTVSLYLYIWEARR
jgi:hypothetical protein